jgi:hypothetical protein
MTFSGKISAFDTGFFITEATPAGFFKKRQQI